MKRCFALLAAMLLMCATISRANNVYLAASNTGSAELRDRHRRADERYSWDALGLDSLPRRVPESAGFPAGFKSGPCAYSFEVVIYRFQSTRIVFS